MLSCPECGARWVMSLQVSSALSVCPICGHDGSVSMTDVEESLLSSVPHIPFACSKTEASDAIAAHLRGMSHVPRKISKAPVELCPAYVPLRQYEFTVSGVGVYSFDTTVLVRTSSGASLETTQLRAGRTVGSAHVSNVLVDCSSALSDAHLSSILPYDVNRGTGGTLVGDNVPTDVVSVTLLPDEDEKISLKRGKGYAEEAFHKHLVPFSGTYYLNGVYSADLNVSVASKDVVWVPVWIGHIQSDSAPLVLVNGQSGKVTLELPQSKAMNFAQHVALVIAPVLVVIFVTLGLYLLMFQSEAMDALIRHFFPNAHSVRVFQEHLMHLLMMSAIGFLFGYKAWKLRKKKLLLRRVPSESGGIRLCRAL